MKIFIVDDEKEVLLSYKRLLKRRGFEDVEICDKGSEAINIIKENNFDIILLDLLIPDVDGLEILKQTKAFTPDSEYIILTAVDEIESAVKAIRLGAFDYLVKPAETDRIMLSIERAIERKGLKAGLNTKANSEIPEAFSEIITDSAKMKEILNYANIMASAGNPILITGESGTGKELLARGIHNVKAAKNSPFVAVNVASIPETLFESQFFGHKKGSFTGAESNFKGFFEQANNGTLFLDEIGELKLSQQVKLLRVLEEKQVTPLGSQESVPIDVRIVSATNVNIEEYCKEGKFRIDLLYRLKSAYIHLPALNERGNDIIILAKYFIKRASKKHNKNINSITPEVERSLINYQYKGNVRELYQMIENAVILCNSEVLGLNHFAEFSSGDISSATQKLPSLKDNSNNYISYVLEYVNNDKKLAADILGISLRQLQRKVKEMKESK